MNGKLLVWVMLSTLLAAATAFFAGTRLGFSAGYSTGWYVQAVSHATMFVGHEKPEETGVNEGVAELLIDGALLAAREQHEDYLRPPFYVPSFYYGLDLNRSLGKLSRYRAHVPSTHPDPGAVQAVEEAVVRFRELEPAT